MRLIDKTPSVGDKMRLKSEDGRHRGVYEVTDWMSYTERGRKMTITHVKVVNTKGSEATVTWRVTPDPSGTTLAFGWTAPSTRRRSATSTALASGISTPAPASTSRRATKMPAYYRYTHHDGRVGVGHGCWRAIVDALGVPEARKLPDLKETLWEFSDDPWTTKVSEVWLDDDNIEEPIGKLEQCFGVPQPCTLKEVKL